MRRKTPSFRIVICLAVVGLLVVSAPTTSTSAQSPPSVHISADRLVVNTDAPLVITVGIANTSSAPIFVTCDPDLFVFIDVQESSGERVAPKGAPGKVFSRCPETAIDPGKTLSEAIDLAERGYDLGPGKYVITARIYTVHRTPPAAEDSELPTARMNLQIKAS
jgi:hypothetical protein